MVGNQDGFRGRALCAVWGMGSSVLPTALEAVAVAVHFQGAQASLFGLLCPFPASAVILLPPAFKTHARNGPSYWGWPLS